MERFRKTERGVFHPRKNRGQNVAEEDYFDKIIHQGETMKIYIWTDLEGVGGVVNWNQTGRIEDAEAYKKACVLLTAEVNAAAGAAFEAGADEVLVWDGHSAGQNLNLEEIHPDVRVVSGPGRIQWLSALDSTFDAMIMIGAHAMAGTQRAILEHTQDSRNWFNYWVNSVKMGEIGQTAVQAGALGVPVAFVSGDRAACEEAKALLGNIEIAPVKEGLSRTAGILLPPIKARKLIADGVARALRRIKDFKPYKTAFPAEVRIETQNTELADKLERAGWQRIDGRNVKRTAPTAIDILPM
jgi:D-amino peptidase